MATNPFHFTKSSLLALPLPPLGKRVTYRDAKEKGLIIDVRPTGSKSFYLYKKVHGRPMRLFLGIFPDLTVEKARRDAAIYKGQIADGQHPRDKKAKSEPSEEMTFGQLFQQYMERYSKLHKKSWKYDEREVNRFLSGWFPRRLSDIRRSEIQLLHERMFTENGLYQANRILERIRAIYNKGIEWGWPGVNPALGIKKYREKSRDRFILTGEMPFVLQALQAEQNETARDYFYLLLLTGARKTNTVQMRWEEIDWEGKVWRIPDTKNGEPVYVPLLDKAMAILTERKRSSQSEWVFPSSKDPLSHFQNSKRAWLRAQQRATILLWEQDKALLPLIRACQSEQTDVGAVCKAIAKKAKEKGLTLPKGLLDVHLHDIRRTVGSYQAINGTSLEIIGKSLGHKSSQATRVYSRLTLAPVRTSMEQAIGQMFSR